MMHMVNDNTHTPVMSWITSGEYLVSAYHLRWWHNMLPANGLLAIDKISTPEWTALLAMFGLGYHLSRIEDDPLMYDVTWSSILLTGVHSTHEC